MPGPLVIPAAAAGLSLVGDIYKGIQGYRQRKNGENMRADLERRRASGEFNYHTPQEAYESLQLAKNQYQDTRLPGQTQAENKIQANSSQALDFAREQGKSPAEILALASSVNTNQNNAFSDIATSAAERQYADLANYQKQLGEMSDYKDKEWAQNTFLPYQQDRQYAENLIGSGAQNINSSVQDVASGVAGLTSGGDNSVVSRLYSTYGNRRMNNFRKNVRFTPPIGPDDPNAIPLQLQ